MSGKQGIKLYRDPPLLGKLISSTDYGREGGGVLAPPNIGEGLQLADGNRRCGGQHEVHAGRHSCGRLAGKEAAVGHVGSHQRRGTCCVRADAGAHQTKKEGQPVNTFHACRGHRHRHWTDAEPAPESYVGKPDISRSRKADSQVSECPAGMETLIANLPTS